MGEEHGGVAALGVFHPLTDDIDQALIRALAHKLHDLSREVFHTGRSSLNARGSSVHHHANSAPPSPSRGASTLAE